VTAARTTDSNKFASGGLGYAGERLLEVRDLGIRFGGVVALNNYQLDLAHGELLGLIGPNGAGKTTVFNLLSGVLRPSAGRILLGGRDITGAPAHRFAGLGIARTFQNIRLFRELSVRENVMAALHRRHGPGLITTLLGLPALHRAEREIADEAERCLARLGLEALAGMRAGDLAYGDQRRVEIARALASEPSLLLLDEPAAGMNPQEMVELVGLIGRLHQELGLTIILVEHDMKVVMGVCRRIQVLDRGEVIAIGSPEEVQNDPAVIESYLGTRRRGAARAGG
jgi:branched-chain amino acid transport system ATP-binding protein